MKTLAKIDGNNSTPLDRVSYQQFHHMAVGGMKTSGWSALVTLGGVDLAPRQCNSNGFTNKRIKDRSPEQYARQAAHEEMEKESINGIPLFREMQNSPDARRWNLQEQLEYIIHNYLSNGAYIKDHALVLGFQKRYENETYMVMVPYYESKNAMKIVDTILRSYQEEVKKAQDDYQRLTAIARVVRNLHMIHPYQDGNGRTNIFGIMNKCLIEQNFCPAILPHGPVVFGGLKQLDGLVLDMLQGMQAFLQEVQQNPFRQ